MRKYVLYMIGCYSSSVAIWGGVLRASEVSWFFVVDCSWLCRAHVSVHDMIFDRTVWLTLDYYAEPFKALFVLLKDWFARWLLVNLSIVFFHGALGRLFSAWQSWHIMTRGRGKRGLLMSCSAWCRAQKRGMWLTGFRASGFWQIIQPVLATGQTHIHIFSSHFLLLSISKLSCLSLPFTFSNFLVSPCPFTFSNFLVFPALSLSLSCPFTFYNFLVFPVLSLSLTFLFFLPFYFL